MEKPPANCAQGCSNIGPTGSFVLIYRDRARALILDVGVGMSISKKHHDECLGDVGLRGLSKFQWDKAVKKAKKPRPAKGAKRSGGESEESKGKGG